MDELALQRYLQKCELEYRAAHMLGGDTLDWLAPHCGSVWDIAAFLREIGFKIEGIVDEEPVPGEPHRWVVTTSGIVVYANTELLEGFFCKQKKEDKP